MKKYPEHDKLREVSEKAQAIGEFVDWLDGKGIVLAARHQHSEHCRQDGIWSSQCGYSQGELMLAGVPTRKLLAEFFELDEDKIEAEKRSMLSEIPRGS